jgi:hypothetical protein
MWDACRTAPCNLRGLFGCLAITGALGLKEFGASLVLPRRCGSINIAHVRGSNMTGHMIII